MMKQLGVEKKLTLGSELMCTNQRYKTEQLNYKKTLKLTPE